ncbi:N-acetylglucosamine-1-phosphate uridyltransferase (EC 2.7.7.23) / Glucosamine-1-phosphate N-acetyltransferase (EC 2.3.1.157) [uncultured Gammaproteobacteria bacterium]|jgi:bifunctional UDP-N-acetylglucosamine pyrophosphorylase/glucosamine-1-phosphate N-acetyltransferase|nr:N-acetylglucosamine-1-phosphate uridyltransferase (EC 2.7.7.23) / Glucosamine-1-phosphate N-acetyltransferase (EC 2.3.1.157) [uncultured Gammaproteobacteria bacterium]CAC9540214.1 N-acetylglucosamine-1-phosphate uridyltransferase (EC 2.7.7.23) / Glucosamine-1-phosphate N-acetyltransferase (EC 2.3.1.157) [uncultured Gammaproteobacteria bacterium]CAC9550944.1 N-acetylglucosamine-1-phosphate uridyltransferase (EC 2.7.7.23) / Glucosamine-1-phosphate N-acetyltransferase (EC 2.3.1.157) [uncultured G
MKHINAIILAAGKGSRMNSTKPKVLQTLSDKTLLEHVLMQAQALCSQVFVVVGFGGNQVRQSFKDDSINWVEQAEQLGTGHAVQQAMPYIDDDSISLVLYGDVPLIEQSTLEKLTTQAQKNGVALLSVILENPTGYGRIIRQNNQIQAIIEQKDANIEQLKICEVNTGIMAVDSGLLKTYLSNVDSNNTQGEFYLTDIIAMAVGAGKTVASVIAENEFEVAGVNDKMQLAALEKTFQQNQASQFMQQGLTLRDSARFDCRGYLSFGQDCEIDVNVVIEGDVSLGNNTTIAPNCIIKNAKIGDNVAILPNSLIENAVIGDGASIGPFARIRPETKIGNNAKIGNFVEVKKSTIGKGSKISHLSYVGDTVMGAEVNIGAGVITCNYDGTNKHQTTIGDGAFIGSDSQLIAPLVIGKNALIGAGSTITKNAPDNALTLSRAKQTSLKKRKNHD